MEKIYICGRAGCCPHIEEDMENEVMYIVDGNKKIKFNKKEKDGLKKYLNRC